VCAARVAIAIARAACACLQVLTDEADEVVDLFGREPLAEGGHAVAAGGDFLGQLRVRMLDGVPGAERGRFHLLAVEIELAALTLVAVTARAGLREELARSGQLIGGRSIRRGRIRVSCGRCVVRRRLIRAGGVGAGDAEQCASADKDCELKQFHPEQISLDVQVCVAEAAAV
jgi:hypothetical protein